MNTPQSARLLIRNSRHLWIALAALALSACSSHADKVAANTQTNAMVVAQTAFDSHQYAKAETLFRQLVDQAATAAQPLPEQALLMLARSQFQQDKKQAARNTLQQLLDMRGSKAAEAADYLGKFSLDDGKTDQAQAAYRQGLALDGLTGAEEARLLNGLGVSLLNQNSYAQGREAFERAVVLAPDEASYRSNLALGWLMDGQITKARTVFAPLLHYQQLPPRVEMNYALLLLAEGQEQQARLILSRYLSPTQVDHDIRQLADRLATIRQRAAGQSS
ncbi:tetratricopeptide repeat protein [Photobacterium sp. 1_MG-2023]|uniref:tetratricopeptide repeat protein n=1 Tax=Photobacterium sp. 1_MG-2023 TaxID=3062646 RepID=UPI0026E4491C|nr:tetratricopeptide repeat protein [Photobacterium sp. 1_MG-2023]MDO6708214.1 tetratricopeptide repeat protein [Photobacterium sp. 1_MG-2023]